MPTRWNFIGILALYALGAQADVDSATEEACNAIEKAIPDRLAWPYSWTYHNEDNNYWSQIQIDTKAACIVLPKTAQEVSTVVRILNARPSVKYAVKSGGHSPNPGFAAVQDGVLLSLANMKGAKYDAQRDVAYVGPGGQWKDVIADLAPYNRAVVGGRLDVVGVGGYLTGGGLSFLSAQHGMAADSVVNFETVMANGSIVNVNAKTNPDLLVAMRGGGSQFGIVTNFTMKAFPIGNNGQVWGGPIVFSDANREALLEAFHDFTENPADPRAAIILTATSLGSSTSWLMHRFYDGVVAPDGVFKKFEQIPHVTGLDGGRTRSYGDLLAFDAFGSHALLWGRMNFRMLTMPLLPGTEGVDHIKEALSLWATQSATFSANNRLAVQTFAMQSFPSLIGQATERAGGNAMGLTANDGPRWMIEFASVHTDSGADASIVETSRRAVSAITQDVKTRLASRVRTADVAGAKVEDYNPLFVNDAAFDQDVFSSYKDFSKFRALQKQVDPNGFWMRTGGFHFKQ